MRAIPNLAVGLVVFGCLATGSQAEILIGLSSPVSTLTQSLVTFDSGTPSAASSIPITGMVAGDRFVGIDRRPSEGRLYGLAVNSQFPVGRIYTFNEATGVATLRSTLVADPSDTDSPFPYSSMANVGFAGVDFSPAVDRLRVMSGGGSTGANLRINVDTGAVQLDVAPSYRTGDVRSTPNVSAIAYSNNVAGASVTTLRAVDANRAPVNLTTVVGPDEGVLQSGLNLPALVSGLEIGYDISGRTDIGYIVGQDNFGAALFVSGTSGFTKVGNIGEFPERSQFRLIGLAAPIPEPQVVFLMTFGVIAILIFRGKRDGRLR